MASEESGETDRASEKGREEEERRQENRGEEVREEKRTSRIRRLGGAIGSRLRTLKIPSFSMPSIGGRISSQPTNWVVVFFLCLVADILKLSSSGFIYGFSIDVLVAFILYFLVFGAEERTDRAITELFIVIALESLLPVLLDFDIFKASIFLKAFLNPILTPWWVIYALVKGRNYSKTLAFLFIAYLMIFIGAFFFTAIPGAQFNFSQRELSYDNMQSAKLLFSKASDFYSKLWDSLKSGVKNIGRAFDRQIKYATGEAYVGKVEDNQDKELGVFIKDIKPTDRLFYLDDSVSVWAKLAVKTFDDVIKVKLSCFHGKKNEDGTISQQLLGNIDPEEITITDFEENYIDCSFLPGSIIKDDKVTVMADFNFETVGYIKSYFMDREKMRALRKQGLDPLDEYGIKEKKPIARFTNGPVSIGIGMQDPPIGLSLNKKESTFRFGITLQPNFGWKGKIKRVKQLVVMLPEHMELKCNSFVKKESYSEKECIEESEKYTTRALLDCAEENSISREEVISRSKITSEPVEALNYKEDNRQDNKDEQSSFPELSECIKKKCIEENKGYNVYEYNIAKNDKSFMDIGSEEKPYKTITCKVTISDPAAILGSQPITTKYIRVKARYDYEIEASTSVNIKEESLSGRDPESTIVDGYVKRPTDKNMQVHYVLKLYDTDNSYLRKYSSMFLKDIGEKEEEGVCLIAGIITQESGGRIYAKGKKGDSGLMQIMPETAAEIRKELKEDSKYKSYSQVINKNIFNPETNIMFGTYYIAKMLDKVKKENCCSNYEKKLEYGLGAYNAGFGNIKKWCGSLSESKPENCLKNYNSYVKKVMDYKENCLEILKQQKNEKTENIEKCSDSKESCGSFSEESCSLEASENKNQETKEKEGKADNVKSSKCGDFDVELIGNRLTLKRGNKNIFISDIDKLEKDNGFYWHKGFPFIRLKIDGNSIKIISIKGGSKTRTESMDSLKKEYKDGKYLKELYPLWKKDGNVFVYAEYNGDKITLVDKNRNRLCDINWPIYTFLPKSCTISNNNDEIAEITANYIKSEQHEDNKNLEVWLKFEWK